MQSLPPPEDKSTDPGPPPGSVLFRLVEDGDTLRYAIAGRIMAFGGHDQEEAETEARAAMQVFFNWLWDQIPVPPSENSAEGQSSE